MSVVAYLANGNGFMVGPCEKSILRIIERNEIPKEIVMFRTCKLKNTKQHDKVYWTQNLYSIIDEAYEND